MVRITAVLSVAAIASAVVSAAAQKPTDERLLVEVASSKEDPFAPGLMGLDVQPGGRVVAMMLPLQMLITAAYDILPAQLSFVPDLPDAPLKTMYDIKAKAEANAIP